jgi:hypothetical protein
MTDKREFAENLRIRIRALEAEIEELSGELRKLLTPVLTPIVGLQPDSKREESGE